MLIYYNYFKIYMSCNFFFLLWQSCLGTWNTRVRILWWRLIVVAAVVGGRLGSRRIRIHHRIQRTPLWWGPFDGVPETKVCWEILLFLDAVFPYLLSPSSGVIISTTSTILNILFLKNNLKSFKSEENKTHVIKQVFFSNQK